MRLAGPERRVLVEAGAGCGKTHELIGAAADLAASCARGEEVLLLTHTNAARDEFRARATDQRISFQTLDSLACEIVAGFTRYLGLQPPLRPDAPGQPTFAEIRELAARLLEEAAPVARAYALRYPVVFVDEFQDTSPVQSRIVDSIALAGDVRLRLFGDRLQTIYDFADQVVPWASMVDAEGAATLATPWRWRDAPRLGAWLAEAREALLNGRSVSLSSRPPEVVVEYWSGAAPKPGQEGYAPECLQLLGGRSSLSRAILVRNRSHAVGLCKRRVARLYEGVDGAEAAAYLDRAAEVAGDPRALALLLVEVLSSCGTGITRVVREQVQDVCRQTEIVLGRKEKIRPLADQLRPLYDDPSVRVFLHVLRSLLLHRREVGWQPCRWQTLVLLADRRLLAAEDVRAALEPLVQLQKQTAKLPTDLVATIHRVKGREFDEVVLPYASAASFTDDDASRRLLYVALTRARRRLTILIPRDEPTPLLAHAGVAL